MTTLTFSLPDVDGNMHIVLRGAEPSDPSVPPEQLNVLDATLVHDGDHADVYKGVLFCGGEKKDDVVLKVIFGDSPEDFRCLEVEYEFYRKLEPIQGNAIPFCHGLFRAHDEPVACLMLEFWGSPLDCHRFRDLDIDLR